VLLFRVGVSAEIQPCCLVFFLQINWAELKEPAPIDYNRADDTICNSTPAMRRWYDRLTTVVVWRRSRTGSHINIWKSFYLKAEYIRGAAYGGSECDNRISRTSFIIVFHSNYGSILLSFRDVTTGRTTDGSTSANNVWPLRRKSSNFKLLNHSVHREIKK